MPVTVGEALRAAISQLSDAGVASPQVDARELAAHLLGVEPMQVPLLAREPMPPAFAELVARRSRREPLQHILGVAYFGPLRLSVGPGVFIPRPETEVLADWAVRQLSAPGAPADPLVVDLCSGSGAIAGYIATQVPRARVVAVELDDHAITYARRNVDGLPNVQVLQGDATDPATTAAFAGQAAMVVSNPPYVPESSDLQQEVYADPHRAVFAGDDGMSVLNDLVEPIAALLLPNGQTMVEHDDSTSAAVQELFRANGSFTRVEPVRDLAGRDRFVKASRL